jgi:hypothetical protein
MVRRFVIEDDEQELGLGRNLRLGQAEAQPATFGHPLVWV